jgi:hypothetical protein
MHNEITNRIATWLLSSGIQIQTGAEAGAVAGWLNASGEPAFAYTEITGYYLSCMAFMRAAGRSEPIVASNAKRAVIWLHAKCTNGNAPLTRYYLQQGVADWRNEAVFSFDLAIVLRGLASVRGLVPEKLRQDTVDALHRHFCVFVSSDGQLVPYIHSTGKLLPDRWSTRPGPCQLKTAAALLCSGDGLAEELKQASFNMYARWRAPFLPHADELHAALYAVEGLILFGVHGCHEAWKAAADQYVRSAEQLTYARSDVVAQALRAGCVLLSRGLLQRPGWDEKIRKLAEVLAGYVGKDGAVLYSDPPASSPLHLNACSAMFAYQAFTFYKRCPHANSATVHLF